MACAPIICLEGNISAGKSTLCREIADMGGFRVFLEPTVKNPFLDKFYQDPKRYGLRMQIWLLRQRYFTYLKAIRHILDTGEGVVLDRSVFSDFVFAKKNYDDGQFDDQAYSFYLRLRDRMLSTLPFPHIVLYLDVSPRVCFNRVHQLRGRDCEAGIPLAYLSGLDSVYQELLSDMEAQGAVVLRKEWSQFGNVREVLTQISELGKQCTWNKCIKEVLEFTQDREAIQRILYSTEEIPGDMDHAQDLLDDVHLALVDGDDPEDVLAKGASYLLPEDLDLDLDISGELSDSDVGSSSEPSFAEEEDEDEVEEEGSSSSGRRHRFRQSAGTPEGALSRDGGDPASFGALETASPIRA